MPRSLPLSPILIILYPLLLYPSSYSFSYSVFIFHLYCSFPPPYCSLLASFFHFFLFFVLFSPTSFLFLIFIHSSSLSTSLLVVHSNTSPLSPSHIPFSNIHTFLFLALHHDLTVPSAERTAAVSVARSITRSGCASEKVSVA